MMIMKVVVRQFLEWINPAITIYNLPLNQVTKADFYWVVYVLLWSQRSGMSVDFNSEVCLELGLCIPTKAQSEFLPPKLCAFNPSFKLLSINRRMGNEI